jgi:tryptophanyl-tRNA synthetase
MGKEKLDRILSGIQPSGDLHLGNYFGAIEQFKKRQDGGDELYIFVADWHSLTTVTNPNDLRKNIRQIVSAYMAFGLDAGKTTLYRQSDVPAIQEIAWILCCHSSMGRLQNAHSYKDKTAKGINSSVGLFTYPILMAADILSVQADVVPVGKDQKQHVEIAQEIAKKINHVFGQTFTVPKVVIPEDVSLIPGTDGQKMSKSYGNTIDLFATDKILKKQVNAIVTDPIKQGETINHEKCNIFQIFKLMAQKGEIDDLKKKYESGSIGFGGSKAILLDKIHEKFDPARKDFFRLMEAPEEIDKVFTTGKEKAEKTINETLIKIRKKVGLA